MRLLSRFWVRAALAALAAPPSLHAQQPDSGAVLVTVREPMGPVAGATVRSEGRSLLTDGEGRTRLVLPAGRRTIEVARIGYEPRRVSVVVIADTTIAVTIDVAMEGDGDAHEMEAITVTATRTERLADDTPLRVEVLDEMEVDENTLMAPSGITMLLNETPGLRVLAASPSLGTGSVRILGLPGQYTAMLADGLPLYGGASSSLGPLDISPVDLLRVEVIKGAASALYGGQALGGVINLVSKPATGRSEVLLNRRTLGVSDAAAFLSRRFGEQSGLSLLVSGTRQDAQDLDDDGWADQARARRWGVRPRYTMADDAGRSLFVTAGYGYDRRDGGTLGAATAPDGFPFREGLTSRRADAGATLRLPRDSGYVALRLSVAINRRQRVFGAGPAEADRVTTGFAEVSRAVMRVRTALAAGAALQFDGYTNARNPDFASDWLTPGVFVTGDRVVGPVTVSLSLRGDWHPAAGFQLTERLALLARPAPEWSVRLSAGTGFAPPTPLNEETEAIGLRRVTPPASLDPERSLGLMADVSGRLLGVELLITTYGSYVSKAIQLVPLGDTANSGTLRNAAGTSRIAGAEGAVIWRFAGGRLLLSYGYARGSRTDAVTGARETMPMIHRHRAGGDLMLEKPGVYRVGIEGIWYGAQDLDDNPYRSRSRPYLYGMAIASRQFGPLELVANFENLFDVRQTRHDPLVLPAPMTGGRWTTDVWAPLEGFMANVAVRYRWPAVR